MDNSKKTYIEHKTGQTCKMTEKGFAIHSDGSAGIYSGGIEITGITPFINETPVLPFFYSADDASCCYRTSEGSITRAAEVLYVTQPTVSKQILELEDELGTSLFTRRRNSMVLTVGTWKN